MAKQPSRGGKPSGPRKSSGPKRDTGVKRAGKTAARRTSTGPRAERPRSAGPRSTERPRSAGPRSSERPRTAGPRSSERPRAARPQSGDKPRFGDRVRTGEKPRFGDRARTGEKPRFGDRARTGEKPRFGDRARTGDKPRFGDRRPSSDRPRRAIGDRPTRVRSTGTGEEPTKLKLRSGEERATRAAASPRTSAPRTRNTDEAPKRGITRRAGTKPRSTRPTRGPIVRRAATSKPSGDSKLVKREKPTAPPQETKTVEGDTIRLNRFIASAGITSRRKADELISQGAVSVNGKVVTELGTQVKPYADQVTVNGATISLRPRYLYLLLNKPKDTITTTSDEKDRTTVLDYVETHERVYPVGRLDRNTTGALLLTNDGDLTNRLTHPSFEVEREYQVTLDKALTKDAARKIAEGGIDIGDGDITGPAEVSFSDKDATDVLLRLREGKNREVRRLFETMGYEVEKLDRISFAGITHRGLARGASRTLTPKEVRALRKIVGLDEE